MQILSQVFFSAAFFDARLWQLNLIFLLFAAALCFIHTGGNLRGVFLSFALLMIVGVLLNYGVIDDTYISLRYAKHFAQGTGLVFNPGDRVEGYTSLLWVVLVGGLYRLLRVDLVVAAQTLSLVSAGLVICVMQRWLRILKMSDSKIALVLLLFSVNLPFVFWAFSGMEATLFALLLTLAVFRMSEGRMRGAAVFLSLAALTRPETYALCPAFLAYCFYKPAYRRKTLFECAGIFAVLILPHVLWRHAYYGYWLPNTFYAKVDFSSRDTVLKGLSYFAHGLWVMLPLFILALKNVRRIPQAVALFLVLHLAVILYTGGDHFIELRFFVYFLPLLLLSAFSDTSLAHRERNKIFCTIILLCGVWSITVAYLHRDMGRISSHIYGKVVATDLGEAGKWLKENAAPSAILATPVVGAMAYYAELQTIDMHGLTDAHIGHKKIAIGTGEKDHEKFDMAYVFSREPDYIFMPLEGCDDWQALEQTPLPPVFVETLRWAPRDRYAPITVSRPPRVFCFLKKI